VFIKKNIPTVLDKELRRKKGFITIGSVTDAYQPAERKYELTRKSLEVLLKHRGRISILTKSNLILRDIDIIEKFEEAHVGIFFFINTVVLHISRGVWVTYGA